MPSRWDLTRQEIREALRLWEGITAPEDPMPEPVPEPCRWLERCALIAFRMHFGSVLVHVRGRQRCGALKSHGGQRPLIGRPAVARAVARPVGHGWRRLLLFTHGAHREALKGLWRLEMLAKNTLLEAQRLKKP